MVDHQGLPPGCVKRLHIATSCILGVQECLTDAIGFLQRAAEALGKLDDEQASAITVPKRRLQLHPPTRRGGGRAPFGYRHTPASGALVRDADEQRVLAIVARSLALGHTNSYIVRALNKRRLRTRGQLPWKAGQVAGLRRTLLHRGAFGEPDHVA